ncbi:hypothetical protein [uncultured Polaribacter sp.]|uniref:hypothetical protein n=1 Tax=uncultured Polaribacter sp. TaxID=174711 RepID=UPI0026034EF8|nr:hypothetical protein [uncultured Polaribacter sp.]
MEKVKIYYKPEVVNYINALVFELYEKEYFGFLESAISYKNNILDYIEANISTFPTKLTPLSNAYLGSYYMFYLSNRRTTWYIFFEKEDNTYLVTYISNNHNRISNRM